MATHESIVHQSDPSITCLLIDRERGMSQSQLWVTSMLQIILRATKTKNQEHAQANFCPLQVLHGIHWPQDIIRGDLFVERANELTNSLSPDRFVDIIFCQCPRGGYGLVGQRILTKAGAFFPAGQAAHSAAKHKATNDMSRAEDRPQTASSGSLFDRVFRAS